MQHENTTSLPFLHPVGLVPRMYQPHSDDPKSLLCQHSSQSETESLFSVVNMGERKIRDATITEKWEKL